MSENFTQQDYAQLAASADNRTGKRGRSNTRATIPPAAWAVLALVGIAGFFWLSGDVGPERKITDPDSENFSTISPIPPTVPPSQVSAIEEPNESKFVVIEPEMAIAPPPPILQPAIPATPTNLESAPPITPPTAPAFQVPGNAPETEAPVDNSAEIARLRAMREAEVERLRQLAAELEAERLARLKSPLIVFDGSQVDENGNGSNPVPPSTEQSARASVPENQ